MPYLKMHVLAAPQNKAMSMHDFNFLQTKLYVLFMF